MAHAISAQQLTVTFARRGATVAALRALDLDLPRGQILGLLGPNGSGKTTLLRVLAGLQAPTAGQVQVLGLPAGHQGLRLRVGYQPEGPLPLPMLSAPDYLAYVGAALGLPNATSDARAAALLEQLDLRHAGSRRGQTFSTGMQKRLHLAAALLGDPELLLLDEPTSGLDPFGSELVMQLLQQRAAAGGTVLLASHHLLEVEELCAEVLVLHGGELAARGPLAELLGTDTAAVVVRGLAAPDLAALAAEAMARGATAATVERRRDHLFALFRRLSRRRDGAEPRA
jgi:ABC-2 type transport system ATP-binding protein